MRCHRPFGLNCPRSSVARTVDSDFPNLARQSCLKEANISTRSCLILPALSLLLIAYHAELEQRPRNLVAPYHPALRLLAFLASFVPVHCRATRTRTRRWIPPLASYCGLPTKDKTCRSQANLWRSMPRRIVKVKRRKRLCLEIGHPCWRHAGINTGD